MTILKRTVAAVCAVAVICLCVCVGVLTNDAPIPVVPEKPATVSSATSTTTQTTTAATTDTTVSATAPTTAATAPVLQGGVELMGETADTVPPADATEVPQEAPPPETTDSDCDGLSDAEEEEVLGTDPNVYDTDSDGARDGFETQLGTDPLTPDETFDITRSHRVDGDAVEVTVEATLTGEQAETLDVTPAALQTLFPDTMPGYIGAAYDVRVDGGAENTTVSFAIDTACDVIDPVIYYFDAATQAVTPVPTTLKNGIATATVTANATYVLLDRVLYEGSLSWEDTWAISDVYSGIEVALVIDDSASMKKTDAANQRLTVAADLIDRLPSDSRVGVVRFSSETTLLTDTLTDAAAAKATLTTTNFLSQGGTRMYTAVHEALTLFDNSDADVLQSMVVLSDGIAVDTFAYDEIVQQAAEKNIRIFAVGFDGSYERFLQSLGTFAEDTNGSFHYAENADELTFVYDDISKMIDLSLDTDGDTIPDYYEDHAVAFNGTTIALDKTKTDTDYDGVPDNKEVSVELVYNADNTMVYVKGTMLSDPTTADSDYDGTADGSDTAPFNRTFSGTMTSEYVKQSSISFEMDYSLFFGDNTVYSPAISKVSSLYSAVAYELSSLSLNDALSVNTAVATPADMMTYLGMNNPKNYKLADYYDDMHVSEATIGYHNVVHDGELKTVLAVVVRGTNTTIEEWASNCDIGDILKDTDDDDWINTDNHKGFDMPANRIRRLMDQYIVDNELYDDVLTYWVTGHSRGAAIANIIGAQLEDENKTAFTYTFAAPANTLATNAADYATIFNVINQDDFVPCLPLPQWGYTRYGVCTNGVSILVSYEQAWNSFTGLSYNCDENNMDGCLEKLAGILPTGTDPRISTYTYTCGCHGDNTNGTNAIIKNTGMSQDSREKAIAKIPANALPVCIITRYEGGWVGGWDFEVCQTPAYFMQLLAAFMGKEIDAYRYAWELDVAKIYEDAKLALIEVGLSGVEHPHYPETYYLLADNLTAADFS